MKKALYRAALCVGLLLLPSSLAQAQDTHCRSLRGSAPDWTFRTNPSGSVTAKAPQFGQTVVFPSKCVRFEGDHYTIDNLGKPVPQFRVDGSPNGAESPEASFNRGWNAYRNAIVLPPAKP